MSHREKKKKKKEMNKETRNERFYALRDAAYANLPLARKLIREDPSIVAEKNRIGETALHFLVVENQLEAVEFLAQHGSDVNNQNKFGTPAIIEAAQLGYVEMVDLLLKLRARVDVSEMLDEMEMMSVKEEKQKQIIEVLQKHGYTT